MANKSRNSKALPQDTFLRIGQLAKTAGVSVSAIRYYESLNLLTRARRSETGYRLFSVESQNQLRFIVNLKCSGFTLDEIHGVIKFRNQPRTLSRALHEMCSVKLVTLQTEIAKLNAEKNRFVSAMKKCGPSIHRRGDCFLVRMATDNPK